VITCTDDTSAVVPSEESYPGSQGLYEWYTTKLADDFRRENGTAGYTNKGLLTELFIGIPIAISAKMGPSCSICRSSMNQYCQAPSHITYPLQI
jgi:hypothetical protein